MSQLTEACGASRTAVSQHPAKLRLAGLVESRKQSRHVIHRLRDGHLHRLVPEELNHVVTGEPSTTAPTSDGARHCPVCATDTPLPTADGTRPHDAPHERPLSAPSPRPVSATTRRPPCSPRAAGPRSERTNTAGR